MRKKDSLTAIMCGFLKLNVLPVLFLWLQQRNLQSPPEAPPDLNRCVPPWPRSLPAPSNDMDVETELYIGLPGRERSSNRDSD
jgi:hypothetical protein